MTDKMATNIQNVLLTGVAVAFGVAIYMIVQKGLNRSGMA
jgi:hypothetical protein